MGLFLRVTFLIAFVRLQQPQKSQAEVRSPEKEEKVPFPCVPIQVQVKCSSSRHPTPGQSTLLSHWLELDHMVRLNPITGKRQGTNRIDLDPSGFTQGSREEWLLDGRRPMVPCYLHYRFQISEAKQQCGAK